LDTTQGSFAHGGFRKQPITLRLRVRTATTEQGRLPLLAGVCAELWRQNASGTATQIPDVYKLQ
jgi:hypothetical protein